MFDSSVPVLIHFLKALSTILGKSESHCAARKIEPEALLGARLYPDMYPLRRQVQLTTDFAKGIGARLAGLPVPSYPDVETSFAELQARLAKTTEFLGTLTKSHFDGAEARPVSIKVAGQEMNFSGGQYLSGYALPNFYFHLTTAYNILRHNGLEIGKGDYMGRA